MQGDMADRQKMRQYDVQKERLAKQQAEADEMFLEARSMVQAGWDVERITADLKMKNMPHGRAYIEQLVAEEKRRQAAGEDAEDEQAPLDGAPRVSRVSCSP